MSFQKISKEEWFKLTKEEQDHLTFEFNKSVEKRKRITIIATRGIALLCVLTLMSMAIFNFSSISKEKQLIEKYGAAGYCYLCGQYASRKCECTYFSNGLQPENMTKWKLDLAEYNSKACKSIGIVSNETVVVNPWLIEEVNLSN
jgi:hypothetical protein